MKHTAAVLALLAPLGSLVAQPTADSWRARVSTMMRDTVLANGLTVVVAEKHTTPLATIEVTFRTGAVAQKPGEEGIAHLLEHVLFRSYGEEGEFAGDVANLNGTYNGTTGEEQVNYWITVPSKEAVNAVRVIAKLVRNSTFRSRELNSEKRIVVDELARNSSDAGSRLPHLVGSRLWGDDWTRKNPGGTRESVEAVKLERLQALYAEQYVPANAAIVVSGDIKSPDVIAEIVKRFGDWKAAPAPASRNLAAAVPTTTTSTVAVGSPDEALVTLVVQWAGPSVREAPADDHAADVFASAVLSNAAGVVPRLVESGVIHSVTFASESQGRRGAMSLTAVITPSAAEQAFAVIKREVDGIASPSFVTEEVLFAGRKDLIVRSEYSLEAGSSLAHSMGFWWSVADLEYFRDYGDAVARVDLQQLQSFASRYIAGKPYVVGALTPAAESERINRLLAAFASPRP